MNENLKQFSLFAFQIATVGCELTEILNAKWSCQTIVSISEQGHHSSDLMQYLKYLKYCKKFCIIHRVTPPSPMFYLVNKKRS